MFWNFGSGCDFQRTQGNPGNVVDHEALSRGFMVASSEMTQYGTHCNDVTSAETVIVVKEYIAENYGVIRYTMSDGGLGGAHQQNLHSSNYPGLIQGMLPTQTFQGTWTPGREFADCGLLKRYYGTTAGTAADLTNYERAGVAGHRWQQVCEGPAETNMAGRTPFYIDPAVGCNNPANQWSLANLKGVRCTLQDFLIAILGPRDTATGYAKTPQDNVGIQYGYNALNAGRISVEKFVTLNEQIGGYDINGQWQPSRMKADPDAAEITHRSGRVTHGKYLGEVAIIDRRDFNIIEEHYDFRSWVMRNRLLKEHGDSGNQVIWRYKTTPPNLAARAFETVNWLAYRRCPALHRMVASWLRRGASPFGRLNVRVGDDDELSAFVFRTTRLNSSRTLATRLRYLHEVSGGLLSTLPLELRLRGKSTKQSHRAPIYYVDLTLRGGMSLHEGISQARTDWDARKASRLDQAALDAAARQGLGEGVFEESTEECAEIVDEFYPEATGEAETADRRAVRHAQQSASSLSEKLTDQLQMFSGSGVLDSRE